MDRQFVVILLSIPYYFLLKESIFCMCRFACVSVDHMLAWCPQQSEGTGFPETGSYRQSWAVMWMLGTKPGSPGRTAGALDLWATSSAPLTLLFNLLLKHTHTTHRRACTHTQPQPSWKKGFWRAAHMVCGLHTCKWSAGALGNICKLMRAFLLIDLLLERWHFI